jgi:hypothetical protein
VGKQVTQAKTKRITEHIVRKNQSEKPMAIMESHDLVSMKQLFFSIRNVRSSIELSLLLWKTHTVSMSHRPTIDGSILFHSDRLPMGHGLPIVRRLFIVRELPVGTVFFIEHGLS